MFGKYRVGWGLRPVSIEDWFITIVLLIAMIVNYAYNHRTPNGYIILTVIVIIYYINAYLTGGAPSSLRLGTS